MNPVKSDWTFFEHRFQDKKKIIFEWLSYLIFCYELYQEYGIDGRYVDILYFYCKADWTLNQIDKKQTKARIELEKLIKGLNIKEDSDHRYILLSNMDEFLDNLDVERVGCV